MHLTSEVKNTGRENMDGHSPRTLRVSPCVPPEGEFWTTGRERYKPSNFKRAFLSDLKGETLRPEALPTSTFP